MADPRLNSLHLEPARRQEFRRARDTLLRACGSHTVFVARAGESPLAGHTVVRQGDGAARTETACWLSDGEFLYPLRVGVNTLGRSGENDVVVEDAYASRRHCAILVHSDQTCELYDTASKNGTYLNGTRLSAPSPLRPGDQIRISNRQYVFRARTGNIDSPTPQATLSG